MYYEIQLNMLFPCSGFILFNNFQIQILCLSISFIHWNFVRKMINLTQSHVAWRSSHMTSAKCYALVIVVVWWPCFPSHSILTVMVLSSVVITLILLGLSLWPVLWLCSWTANGSRVWCSCLKMQCSTSDVLLKKCLNLMPYLSDVKSIYRKWTVSFLIYKHLRRQTVFNATVSIRLEISCQKCNGISCVYSQVDIKG